MGSNGYAGVAWRDAFTMVRSTRICGVGYYVPERRVTNEELASRLDTTAEWIRTKLGIRERRIVEDDAATSDLAATAARQALKNAKVRPEEVDLIVLATNMPDHISPACAVMVQRKICATKAVSFDVRSGGCTGLIHALSIGSKYIADGTYHTVLVIAADVNSRGINWNDRLTAVIFGDGASAMLLQPAGESGARLLKTNLFSNPVGYYDVSVPDGYYGAYVPAGGSAEPLTVEGLQNGRQFFAMNGKAIFEFATTVFPRAVIELVEGCNLSLAEIDYVIAHQANLRIITESMKKLGLPMDKTYCNIERYGNTGGASVGIALAEGIENGVIRSGNKVVLVTYGAGFSWATALLTL